jgi:predicted permease
MLAVIAVQALRIASPPNLPRMGDVGIDVRMLVFAIGASLVTTMIFSIMPALRASRVDPNAVLRAGVGTSAQAHASPETRTRQTLIAAEVAFSLIVLVGAALLVKSYQRIARAKPGFDPRNVLSFRISLPAYRYKTADAISQFYDQLDRSVGALPGVESVGSNYQLPLSSVAVAWEPIGVDGYVPKRGNALIIASSAYVSVDYFRTMGMPLLHGRVFAAQDNREAPPIVIVNQNLAARFWPNEPAIGKRIRQGNDGPWRTIVGVINDTRDYEPLAQPPIAAYFPVEQFNIASRFVVARTASSVDPSAMTKSVLRALHAIDPDLPAYDIGTMDRRLSDSLSRRRVSTMLLGAFAIIALALAAIGIYGVIAYWVEHRTREIGIRVALGANRVGILALIARQLGMILIAGIAVGLSAAVALTRLLAGLLFGVTANDLATFSLVPLLLAVVAVFAALVPARRAVRIEPAVAMRVE